MVLAIDQKTFSWAIMSKNTKKKLEYLSSGRTIENVLGEGISLEEINAFYDTGLLSIDGKSNSETIIPKEAKTGLHLAVLHTSNACNMRCTYCYPSADKGRPMSFEVAKSTVDKLSNQGENHINLEFHGGEPLINFKLIKEVVGYASKKFLDSGESKFCYSIQTNATLLTEEIVSFLKEHEIEVGISLDGLANRNNKTRIYPNNKGTYDDILKGINLLREGKVPFSTIMVIKDLQAVDEVYPFMVETGIHDVKLASYFKQGRATESAEILDNMKEYGGKVLNLTDRIVEHNLNSNSILKLSNVATILNNILSGKRTYMCMRFPCGAGDSMMGIDVDGSVYPCEEMNGKKELIVGNILNDSLESILNSSINKKLRTRQAEDFKDCLNCPIISACEVSCANHSYNNSGNFYSKSDSCEYYKVMIPGLMWRLHENPKGMKTLL